MRLITPNPRLGAAVRPFVPNLEQKRHGAMSDLWSCPGCHKVFTLEVRRIAR